jgi:hypothetical protein
MFRTGDVVHIFGLREDTTHNSKVGTIVKLIRRTHKTPPIRYHVRLHDGVVLSIHPNNVSAQRNQDNTWREEGFLIVCAMAALAAYCLHILPAEHDFN